MASTPTTKRKIHKELDTAQKLEVLKLVRAGNAYTKIATEFGISKGSITSMKKRAHEFEEAANENFVEL